MKASKKRYAALADAMATGTFVRLRCRLSPKWKYDGYIVGLNEKFVLLHNAVEYAFLNGYSVLPLREIRNVDMTSDFVIHRALQMEGQFPSAPSDILLDDWPSLLASADAYFPLITIHPAHRYPGDRYIGRVSKLKKRSVVLREIDPKAKWIKPREPYRFADITEVNFGGRYEAALWRVAQTDSEPSDLR